MLELRLVRTHCDHPCRLLTGNVSMRKELSSMRFLKLQMRLGDDDWKDVQIDNDVPIEDDE